jgi:pyruvate dehydrogenase (quinone)
MPRQLQGIDYFQATNPDLLFRDVSLYTETISSPAQAPAVIHQAIAAAYAGRGVAHLTLPQDVINAKADGSVSSVATLKPRPEIFASEADIAEIARRIDEAGSIVIMCGAGCHGAAEELRALSERLKAPLIHSVISESWDRMASAAASISGRSSQTASTKSVGAENTFSRGLTSLDDIAAVKTGALSP